MNTADLAELGKRIAGALICAACGVPFKANRRWARFCSLECRDHWHNNHRLIRGVVWDAPTLIDGRLMLVICVTERFKAARALTGGEAVEIKR